MTNHKKLALTIVAVFAGIALTVWWIDRPRRITQEFASHLFHERYEEAAAMVHAPSEIKMAPDGGLTLIDVTGNSTDAPAAKLPFKVGGGRPGHLSNFTMTALGDSTNSVLDSPPVSIYLSIDGGKIRIDRADSH